ncbi:MAG: hypothetical protein ACI4F9_07730 [Lachnospiraceae bacterium]
MKIMIKELFEDARREVFLNSLNARKQVREQTEKQVKELERQRVATRNKMRETQYYMMMTDFLY